MTNSVMIDQITYSDMLNDFRNIVKDEYSKLTPKEPTNQKDSIYGTRKEVAKELKISLPILHEHTKNGTIPAFRIGGRVLYRWTDIHSSIKVIQSLKYKRSKL